MTTSAESQAQIDARITIARYGMISRITATALGVIRDISTTAITVVGAVLITAVGGDVTTLMSVVEMLGG